MKRERPEFLILLFTLATLALGLVMVFSASSYAALITFGDPAYYFKRQLIWALLGLGGLVAASRYPYFKLQRWATPLLFFSLVLLVVVLVVGSSAWGSRRWLEVGSLRLQPSELLKLTMVIYLAQNLSRRQEKLTNFFHGLFPLLLIVIFLCALVLAQPDLGTAVIIAGTAYLLFFVAGARTSHLVPLLVLGVGAAAGAILLAPYRLERWLAFLDPEADPTGSGFQILQSLLALGSGGFFGVGLGLSKQKLLYVPARHTDFIFAILGEELGFLGTFTVVLLFLFFVWRGLRVALLAPDTFGSLLAAGITSLVGLQAAVNIAAVTRILPVTGITLPLISYGGSSLVFTLVGIGVLLNVSRYHQ